MKKLLGFVPLFCCNLILCLFTIVYCAFYVKDSYHLLPLMKRAIFDDERKRGEKHHEEGIVRGTLSMVIDMFKSVFKKRPNKTHVWMALLSGVIICISVVVSGYSVIGLMFYKLHYDMSVESFGNLITVWTISMFFGQMFIVPFLSRTLGMSDTGIIILGAVPSCIALACEGIFSEVWILFLLSSGTYKLND